MDDHEFEARLKGVRRDLATELEGIEAALAKIGKVVRAKADTDDVQQMALKVANVESDSREGVKVVRSDMQDFRHTVTRQMEGLASSMGTLAESFAAFRRDADNRTADTVNRILAERRPMHWSVPAISGAGGGAGIVGLAIWVLSQLPGGN